jgi:DMSO/TMAO reductase YedYZ heme-binding membrane subunit
VRGRIGAARWRTLHRLSSVAWGLGLVHSIGEGTDAGQIWFLAMLAIVAAPAVLLLAMRWLRRPGAEERPAARPPRGSAREHREEVAVVRREVALRGPVHPG